MSNTLVSLKCSKCKDSKSPDCFYTSITSSTGYQMFCKDCNRANSREYARTIDVDKRRIGSRRTMLKNKYGLTLEDYDNLLKSQNGVCAICERAETSRSSEKGPAVDSLKVDHCHTTGKIRGLLCSECNFGISKFDDNIRHIISAANYILKFKQGLNSDETKKVNAVSR